MFRRLVVLSFVATFALGAALSSVVRAQTAPDGAGKPRLRVATRVIPPFVVKDRGELSGFSIELWRKIAADIGADFAFTEYSSLPEMLGSLKDGRADLAIAAASITEEREREFDFSQPTFEGGLQIMVAADRGTAATSMHSLVTIVFSPAFLELIGLLLLLVLVPAHIVWFSERRKDTGFLSSDRYIPGVFKSAWWAASTLGGQAEEMPLTVLGRVVALVWMFISVLFITSFIAVMTTSMTLDQLRHQISDLRDLSGKRVATVTGSTAARFLSRQDVDVATYDRPETAYAALLDDKVAAVVYDAPVLLYYAAHEGRGKVQVVGSIFRKENYGIVFPPNSPHRKAVNTALLRMRENGEFNALYQKWFETDTAPRREPR